MNTRRLTGLVAPLSLLMLAFVLRMVALDGPALRGDEAHTLAGWTQPMPVVLEEMAVVDPHPPLAYLAFNIWLNAAGTSEFAARYLSVLAGTAAVAVMYGMGRRTLKTARAGALVALLWALNPFQVWHAQDARNYALWAALSAAAVLFMLRALESNRPRDWLLYGALQVAAAYVYYLELFILAFQNVYVWLVYRKTGTRFKRWLLAQTLIVLALAPWYLQPNLWTGAYTGTAGRLEPLRIFTWIAPTLVYGETLPSAWLDWLWAPLWILLAAGLVAAWRAGRQRFLFMAGYAALPLLALSVLSAARPVFRPRYILASAPAYTLLLAVLVLALRAQSRKRLALAVLAGLLTVCGAALLHHYADPAFRKSPGWRELAAYLEARAAPGDLLVQNEPDPAVGYYYGGEHIIAPLHADASPADTAAQLANALKDHGAIWFLPALSWDPAQTALYWLETNAQRIIDGWVGGFRVQQWRAWTVAPAERSAYIPVDIRAGDFARIAGYAVYPAQTGGVVGIAPGAALTLLLYWEPRAAAPVDYTAFAHLIGPANPATGTPLWAQDDHPPQHGRAATSTWVPGVLLRDVFTIDLTGVPPGDYAVQVGLYDPASKERVALTAGDAPAPDNAARLFGVRVLPGGE
ncbi:MAG: glycosyltransferase family 39 protein [Anaerolineae bacterium]|nr:glycosyltransferase family 39 protein [Anaerolineae bacterium]